LGYAILAVGALTGGCVVALRHAWASAHLYRGVAWLVPVCGGQGRPRLGNHGAETAGMTGGGDGRGSGTRRLVQRFVDIKFIDD